MSTLQVLDERSGLPVLPVVASAEVEAPRRRLPEWLKRPIPATGGIYFTRNLIDELGLETVCESARCPNRSECWTRRTATFMILGDDLHPPLRLLRREARPARARRRGRTGAAGRGLRPARSQARRDHLGDPRRPARRRRRALPPLHPGRPRPDRRHDRGPDPRLRRPRGSHRRRALGRARGVQPQPRNRRPPPAARPAQEPVRRQPEGPRTRQTSATRVCVPRVV